MNQQLSNIELLIQQSSLSNEEKQKLLKEISNADKQWNILEFKLDRTEKVKKTTAVLLEETIEELEKKRKDVEAQNKELEIQNALERVRAVALGMKEPADMLEICKTIAQQLQLLGVKEIRNVQTAIFYESKGTYMNYEYYAKHSKTIVTETSYTNHEIPHAFANQMLKGNGEIFITHIKGNEVKEWIAYQKKTNVFIDDYLYTASSLNYYWFTLGPVALGISTYEPLKEEDINLFKRFLKVFELSYTRYLDIEQAIEQAKEAQIEAALEKVRSRSLAVHKSDEFNEVIKVLFERLQELEIPMMSASINVFIEGSKNTEVYICGSRESDLIVTQFRLMHFDHPISNDRYDAYEKGLEFFTKTYNKEEKNSFYKYEFEVSGLKLIPEDIKKRVMESESYTISMAFAKHSMIVVNDFEGKSLSPKQIEIIKRFANVFEQAYIRFLDLQKAEAQTREAQIEAALERVRSIAMSMMKSEELAHICEAVYKQLVNLDFNEIRAAQIYIRNDEEEKFINYDYAEASGADVVEVKYNSHPNTRRIYDVIKTAGDELVHNIISKKELDAWKDYLYNTLHQPPEKNLDNTNELHYYLYSFGIGAFGISTYKKITHEELQILKRFRNVFSLSYQRYTDIALAEAQAREAKIEAALERVRSRTLAMQKSDELAETAAVLFKQLILLSIEPNRLYISIMKDDEGETEFWITDEDGSKVSMAYEDNLNNNSSFKKMFEGWLQQKKSLLIDMKGKELEEYLNYLSSIHVPFKGGLTQKRRLQYIAYFNRGFIGMASPDEQPQETMLLLERFAAVFNLTFTRFNDLKVAEAHALQAEHDLIEIKAARKKAEETLAELQSTQKQLIQSEKMASLGELTAGIAHEIQNPLNFVNNFSEVNRELIEELKSQKSKLKIEEVDELLNDIAANEEKIIHHGKRADAIVKGMLQHSRQTSGTKEPTDINALCDEYLRLSYHGLRAKDKSFNADFKTDFDESIGKINLVPQDLGRVFLNLFNNAFYAVNDKKKTANESYHPTVSVQTKKINNKIEITVSDNGHGIPQNIIDKIFQPFFTTKPTGQGTGLGLSLAYDIITKQHNGTIKAESKEGEGTTFIIQLSINLI